MGLSDIDEDDGPIMAPPPKQQQQQLQQPQQSAKPAATAENGVSKPTIDLDDLFSGVGVSGNATSSSAPAPAARQPMPTVTSPPVAPAPSDDVLDSLFAMPPMTNSNASPSPTGSVGSYGAQSKPNANVLFVDGSASAAPDDGTNLFDTSKPTEKQKFSTADSLLEAFSRQGKKGGATRFGNKDSLDHLTKNKDDNKVRARLLALMDYYDVLGVTHTASEEEIRRNYKRKALELHPDRVGRDQTAEEAELFKTITKAYEVLTDPEKKAEYDRQVRCGGGFPAAAAGPGMTAGGGGSGMQYPPDAVGSPATDWFSHWQKPQ